MSTDTRSNLKKSLQALPSSNFRDGHLELLEALGYRSDKTMPVPKANPAQFIQLAESGSGASIDKAKARYEDWNKADILFQLTDEELGGQSSLFEATELKPKLLQSYLFFAIELKGTRYSRTDLSTITRQINRLFPMPVMVFYTYNGELSIAVINRRRNKREEHKDVLGKVTLIHGINLSDPHRGHLDIIDSFSVESLRENQTIDSFDALHTAWEEIFNVELLNKRFYRELSDWYFWALDQVEFPDDVEKNRDTRNATSLIRLLTRIIFCWFLKEKGLIPDNLFQAERLEKVLKSLKSSDSTFYQAILQNLFFATLNQRMGKDGKGEPYRRFITNKTFQGKNEEHGIKNLFRYEEHFAQPEHAVALFEDIPFLNGGLFECLDREDDKKTVQYLDGFSQRPKKRPTVPNELFFGDPRVVDLSKIYDDKKRRNQKVRGLIHILSGYKFTIVENTPIEQEIALDPELLGQVFENLLASYNPETQTTARKQTGSFYTPRPIVDYMVTESLKCYLKGELIKHFPSVPESDADEGLDILFSYTEKEHTFTDDERAVLIQAIDNCKILDPACGSGAFPMGALHKLVFILQKLDPHNEQWEQLRIDEAQQIQDRDERRRRIEQIANDFRDNDDDYGRKLYLIESCLYGVDIQPIAIQITKLRCFISLVCDQRANRNKAKNHGIRPLPNLETKFVAANTLLGLPKQMDLQFSPTVEKLEKELEEVRHQHFAATTRREKLSLQKKDKALREKLAHELRQTTFSDDTSSRKLVAWNPYDATSIADFFDAEWMFGKGLHHGFNIAIGNPPYLKERDNKSIFDTVTSTAWGKQYSEGKMDYWYFFLHMALENTREGGVVSFITSRYWIDSTGTKKLVRHIRESAKLFHVVDIGKLPVFQEVAGYHMLHFYQVGRSQGLCVVKKLEDSLSGIIDRDSQSANNSSVPAETLFKNNQGIALYKSRVDIESSRTIDSIFGVSQGVVQNPDKVSGTMAKRYDLPQGEGVFVLTTDELRQLELNHDEQHFVRDFFDEKQITPYYLNRKHPKHLLYITKETCSDLSKYPNLHRHLDKYREIMDGRRETIKGTIEWFQLHWPRKEEIFTGPKVAIPSMFKEPCAAYVETEAFFGIGSNVVYGSASKKQLQALPCLLNSSLGTFWFNTNGKKRGAGVDIGVSKLREFPIPNRNEPLEFLATLGCMRAIASADNRKQLTLVIDDIIDACVMECYFQTHMAERDLLFFDDLYPSLDSFDPNASDSAQRAFLEQFVATHNAPKAKVRNKLLRLTADSPDLLAVIKNEGSS